MKRYQLNVKVQDAIVLTTAGYELESLKTLAITKTEAEATGAKAEVIYIDTHEVVFRCKKSETD